MIDAMAIYRCLDLTNADIKKRPDGSWVVQGWGNTPKVRIRKEGLVNGMVPIPLPEMEPDITMEIWQSGLSSFHNFHPLAGSLLIADEPNLTNLTGMPDVHSTLWLRETGIDLSTMKKTAAGGLPYYQISVDNNDPRFTWVKGLKAEHLTVTVRPGQHLLNIIKASGVERIILFSGDDAFNGMDWNRQDELNDLATHYKNVYASSPSKAILGFQTKLVQMGLGHLATL